MWRKLLSTLSKMSSHKIVLWIIYTVTFVCASLIVIRIWWILEDPHMIKVNNATETVPVEDGTKFMGIPLHSRNLRPGDVVLMHLDYCKLKNTYGNVVARLVGKKIILRLNWPNDDTKAGCSNAQIPILLPDKLESDTYYVEFEILYHVNPVKDRRVIMQSDSFEVSD